MNIHAWGAQRARYSPARRGRHERGATLVECALIQGAAEALRVRKVPRPASGPVTGPVTGKSAA